MRLFMPFTFLGALFLMLFNGSHNPLESMQMMDPCSSQTACPVLVFDLGGVLVDTNKSKVMWEIGPVALFNYWRQAEDAHALKAKLYETLNAVSKTTGNSYNVRDDEGNLMPLLMVEWLQGTRSNQEILSTVVNAINDNPEWFTSEAEQKVVKNLATVIFTPEIFAKTRTIKPGAVELLTLFKEKGFEIDGISNWDKESIVYMKQNNPELFNLFDHLIISGEVHAIKPNPEIFKAVLKRVPANRCIYIDDQEENIAAARLLSMHTIRVYPDGGTPIAAAIEEHLMRLIPDYRAKNASKSTAQSQK